MYPSGNKVFSAFIVFCVGFVALIAGAAPVGDASVHSSGLYPPQANLTRWLDSSNGTQAVAKVGSNADVVGVNCMENTDTTTYKSIWASTGVTYGTDDFVMQTTMKLTSLATGTYKQIIGSNGGSGSSHVFVDIRDPKFRMSVYDVGGVVYDSAESTSHTHTDALTGFFHYRIEREGTALTFTITGMDGVVAFTDTVTLASASTDLGASSEIHNMDRQLGIVTESFISVGGVEKVHWVFSNGNGLTVPDISGNGVDITRLTAATAWATADGIRSHNGEDGFTSQGIYNGLVGNWDTLIPENSVNKIEVSGNMLGRTAGGGDFYATSAGDVRIYVNGSYQYEFRSVPVRDALVGTDARVPAVVLMDYSDPLNPEMYIDGVLTKTSTTCDFVPTGTTIKLTGASIYVQYPGGTFNFMKLWNNAVLVSHIVPQTDGTLWDLVNLRTVVPSVGATLDVARSPALADGSGLAANGLALTNPGGFPHNGFEGSIVLGTTTNTYSMLAAYTNDVDTTRVSIGPNGRIKNIMEYSSAPTGSELNRLNLYLENIK